MSRVNEHARQYKQADEYVVINDNDPDLSPIVLRLPDAPPMTMIDGYGLPSEKQRFKPLEIPKRLQKLEKEVLELLNEDQKRYKANVVTIFKIQKKFWDKILSNHEQAG